MKLLIVGGGPAGLTAALYAARAGARVELVTTELGGAMVWAGMIENYPGFAGISGYELTEAMTAPLRTLKELTITEGYTVKSLMPTEDGVKAVCTNGKILTADKAILATGSHYRKLGLKNEDHFIGHGLSYCPLCDGAWYAGSPVAVIGGGPSGVEAALYLAGLDCPVTLIEREARLSAGHWLTERLMKDKRITLRTGWAPTTLEGTEELAAVHLNQANGSGPDATERLTVAAVFVCIGREPAARCVTLKKNSDGFVAVDQNMVTSSARILAAGDITGNEPPQIITACSQGCRAALQAVQTV